MGIVGERGRHVDGTAANAITNTTHDSRPSAPHGVQRWHIIGRSARWRLPREVVWVPTRSPRCSVPAEWGKCTKRDTRLDRVVAIKVMPAHAQDTDPNPAAVRARSPGDLPPESPQHLHAVRRRHARRRRLPRHGVSRRRDARRPLGEGPLPIDDVLSHAIEIAGRTGQGAPARHRASRS